MELRVPAEAAGQRLDRYLSAHAGSRAQAQRWIEQGAVTIDGRAARKADLLGGGELLGVDLHDDAPPADDAAQASFTVAYEDRDLLVVDKPAGVVVHPASGHRSGTLSQALVALGAAGGEDWRPGIVHRLDKDTSGLLVIAKSEAVHRRLKAALEQRRIVREYLALVDGRPPARTGTIDAPIGRDRRAPQRMSLDTNHPRDARTHFVLEEALPAASLLRVRLETGRTHQIRAHFAAIGHPVCGDVQYGRAGGYGLERQFLHAARLELAHPMSGEQLTICSPLPADLASALERARGGAQ
ncbi:MAG: RluA family pseudouridine synthase [Solirubrobacteraceae bacterium]